MLWSRAGMSRVRLYRSYVVELRAARAPGVYAPGGAVVAVRVEARTKGTARAAARQAHPDAVVLSVALAPEGATWRPTRSRGPR